MKVSFLGLSLLCSTVLAFGQNDPPKADVEATDATKIVKAKTGQVVYLGVENTSAPDRIVTDLRVKVNGKAVQKPLTNTTGMIGGGYFNFVFQPKMAGKYKVELTAIRGLKGEKEDRAVIYNVEISK